MEEIVLSTNLPDYILKMFQVDYVALIIAMVTVAVGILAVKKFIDEFASAFGFVPICYSDSNMVSILCQT